MFNASKLNQLRKVAQNPKKSDYVQALVTILVELEHRQLEAVEGLHDALDTNGIEVNSTRDQREEQLLDLADAVATGSFESYWFEEVVGQHIENAEDARPYAGLDAEEWEQQIETWADSYRSRAPEEFEDTGDRGIARQHVERKFGVALQEFEREVIEYDRREALRTILAGNFEAVEQGIKAATVEVEHRNGGEADE